jgi:L-ribulose-5-phosphate 3-epimerase
MVVGSLAASALWGKNKISHSQISAITDEIARSPEGAIAFAHQYGLKHLELRGVPGARGKDYYFMSDAEARIAAKQFAENGVRISFLNTNLLKFPMPGTEPARRRPEDDAAREARLARERVRFEQRESDLMKCIRSAQIFECPYVRVFTFSRVAAPQNLYPRIAEVLNSFARIAEREGIKLLVENETSCNVATCAELAALLKMVPSKAIGLNWDVDNGRAMGEEPLTQGYPLLPKKRIHNIQIKGRSILDYPQKLDWAAIFDALANDGYKDCAGLETHIFGETQVQKSHESMAAILKIVDPGFAPRPAAS